MNAPGTPISNSVLFDHVRWRDPISGAPLEPIVSARTPAGVPICGALRVRGTPYGYPIVDCVVRLTPNLAEGHHEWLASVGLEPPPIPEGAAVSFQPQVTVESFGFQWAWNRDMRSEADLQWRIADRFRINPVEFSGRLVLDAGAGAGDQSRWLINQGAQVVSIDLSSAIEVVASKMRLFPSWVGVQGDITALPFADDQFELVYCEGVIQHTRDSALTVRELYRTVRKEGRILATHYGVPKHLPGRIKLALINAVRNRLSRLDRYKLLWVTGNLTALAYVPLLGRLIRLSGLAAYYDLMSDFKTTWTNTFDAYGNHAYQRYITPEEFWSYFESAGGMERIYQEHTLVVVCKTG